MYKSTDNKKNLAYLQLMTYLVHISRWKKTIIFYIYKCISINAVRLPEFATFPILTVILLNPWIIHYTRNTISLVDTPFYTRSKKYSWYTYYTNTYRRFSRCLDSVCRVRACITSPRIYWWSTMTLSELRAQNCGWFLFVLYPKKIGGKCGGGEITSDKMD